MNNLNTQAQSLTELFFQKVKQAEKDASGKFPGTLSYKKTVMEDSYNCLSSGFSFDELVFFMNQSQPDDATSYNLSEYIKRKGFSTKPVVKKTQVRKPNECIEIGTFYYHPLLQLTSRPPRFQLNPKTMEFEKIPLEPFFLEIKDSFTIEELTNYYIKETGVDATYPPRYYSQFTKLISIYGIDLTLYLIDASVWKSLDEQEPMPIVPSFMQSNVQEAKEMYMNRKEIAREGGITHVCPRKRTED